MRIFPQFLALCVAFILVFKVQAAPAGDRLQAMTAAIQPSFSQGLVHLSSLFDLVVNYDETINNGYKADDVTSTIQRAIRSASNSLSETNAIAVRQMQMYEYDLLSLATDISAMQAQLHNKSTALAQLMKEGAIWQAEATNLRQQIADLQEKGRDADQRAIERYNDAREREGLRWLWIILTVFTAGLAAPGLVANENSMVELNQQRRDWLQESDKREKLLKEAESKLNYIANRQRDTEKSIENILQSYLHAITGLEQQQKQYSVLGSLGAQIRKISTFLGSLNGEVGVVHSQQQLMVLFSPLLKAVDSLVSFLEGNVNMVVLLGERKAVSKIHQYFSQNRMLTWGKWGKMRRLTERKQF